MCGVTRKTVQMCLQRELLLLCVMCACVLMSELEGVSVGQKVLEGPPGVLGSPVTLLWTAPLYVSCSREVGRAQGTPEL